MEAKEVQKLAELKTLSIIDETIRRHGFSARSNQHLDDEFVESGFYGPIEYFEVEGEQNHKFDDQQNKFLLAAVRLRPGIMVLYVSRSSGEYDNTTSVVSIKFDACSPQLYIRQQVLKILNFSTLRSDGFPQFLVSFCLNNANSLKIDLQCLSTDTLAQVLSALDIVSICNAFKTCRAFYSLSNGIIWEELCQRDIGRNCGALSKESYVFWHAAKLEKLRRRRRRLYLPLCLTDQLICFSRVSLDYGVRIYLPEVAESEEDEVWV